MKECLIFDIAGDFAHFRKYYTTTSPLTFLFPPRTVIIGIMGAVLGKAKHEYMDDFHTDECGIAIQILVNPQNPIKKMTLKENWRKGTPRISNRGFSWGEIQEISQIPLEVLKNPAYRIYVSHNNRKVFSELVEFIQKHKSVYTPCLGLSEFICDLDYVDVSELTRKSSNSDEFTPINTVIPKNKIEHPKLETGKEYFETTIPNDLTNKRKFNYLDVIFERNGKPIAVKLKKEFSYYSLQNSSHDFNLLFLE